jgi:hypothetical protein
MDSLPVTSMSARRAARRIASAAEHGEAEVVLSVQAKIATTFAALFPGTTAEVNALVNRMLPVAGDGAGTRMHKGRESESEWAPSRLTTLNDQAARENNQIR